jgi:hypothetical protein
MMDFLVKSQVYSTCGILNDHELKKIVFIKRKMKESHALIKEFDGWRIGGLVALYLPKWWFVRQVVTPKRKRVYYPRRKPMRWREVEWSVNKR